ncbi:DUF2270 domain-containing protein [Haloarcula sp. S1CR25-12]|uniref:DUF2270 domain-containing protein n=1 Tax=Haloarcula saliterrae TaxID=2950534 RepID=A0ABU2F9J9_9EURY|nr:DUF2270 domain-containing protein [Haloarcula sp. S1CR25-12]MDS0258942.1 DUF2270 domain-containing protein [Haloarcula sp. S1CR25-12]
MSTDEQSDFDATDREASEVGATAAEDSEEFLSLMPHYYRGEVSQSGNLLSRLDLTIDWAIVLVTAVLALAFQGGDVTAYLLLIGMVGVSLFALFDVRRYRAFDASRARVRVLEENLFANSLDPEEVPMAEWRRELAADLRTPTFKVNYWEALARRLKKVYYPLYALLGLAWAFRISIYTPGQSWIETASVPGIAGELVAAAVAAFFLVVTVFTYWPRERHARGEFHGEDSGDWKR